MVHAQYYNVHNTKELLIIKTLPAESNKHYDQYSYSPLQYYWLFNSLTLGDMISFQSKLVSRQGLYYDFLHKNQSLHIRWSSAVLVR